MKNFYEIKIDIGDRNSMKKIADVKTWEKDQIPNFKKLED